MKFNLKKTLPATQAHEVGAVGYGMRAANDFSYGRAAVAAGLAVASAASQAAAVDVTATVTDIGAQLVPIGLIGVAVLGVFVAVKAFQWVRRALA